MRLDQRSCWSIFKIKQQSLSTILYFNSLIRFVIFDYFVRIYFLVPLRFVLPEVLPVVLPEFVLLFRLLLR